MPGDVSQAIVWRPFVAALVAIALWAQPASAHKINVFAYAEGKTLHGEAYARGGEPIRAAKVEVFDTDGRKLGETVTDEGGNFTFEARFRTDHRLVVDAGDGHEAEYTVPADELPKSLPGRSGDASPPPESPHAPGPEAEAPHEPAATAQDASLAERLDSLASQVVQLRRQLFEYQQQLRLRDILGGIGYILGLMGLAFYFLGVKKRDQRPTANDDGPGAGNEP